MRYQRDVVITVPGWVRLGLWLLRGWYRLTDPSGAWRAKPWPRWAADRLFCVNGDIRQYDDTPVGHSP